VCIGNSEGLAIRETLASGTAKQPEDRTSKELYLLHPNPHFWLRKQLLQEIIIQYVQSMVFVTGNLCPNLIPFS
jgi:hypothetical protein